MSQKKFILSIAGHDPTNAAGTSIDLLVANEFDMHCLSAVSYTHLRAHETGRNLVCRLLLEKKK